MTIDLMRVYLTLLYTLYTYIRSSEDAKNLTPFEQLALPAPPSSSSPKSQAAPAVNPNIDLLSGDDFFKAEPVNSQALVPAGHTPAVSAASGHNTLDLVDMFADSSVSNNNGQNPPISSSILNTNPNVSPPQAYPSQHPVQLQPQPQQPSPYSNGLSSNTMAPYDQSSNPASSWNGQFAQGMAPPQQAPNFGMNTMFYCDIDL